MSFFTRETERARVLRRLTVAIQRLPVRQPRRVAIDGIDAAGKTWLANELAQALSSAGETVIRASIDDFMYPRRERYRQGSLSSRGYFEQAFDYPALVENLLAPLSPGGDRRYRCSVFDYHKDQPVEEIWEVAPPNVVLIIDGVFMLRPEIAEYWDCSVFVQISFAESLHRALRRDRMLFESEMVILQRYRERYFPAQHHYLEEVKPQNLADWILDNEDPAYPRLFSRLQSKS